MFPGGRGRGRGRGAGAGPAGRGSVNVIGIARGSDINFALGIRRGSDIIPGIGVDNLNIGRRSDIGHGIGIRRGSDIGRGGIDIGRGRRSNIDDIGRGSDIGPIGRRSDIGHGSSSICIGSELSIIPGIGILTSINLLDRNESTDEKEQRIWEYVNNVRHIRRQNQAMTDDRTEPVGAPARKDIYCPFRVGPGSSYCLKGRSCDRPHRPSVPIPIEPKRLDEPDEDALPKDNNSTKATLPLFDGFPKQRSPSPCPQGIFLLGKVVHVVDPHEFYIIPQTDVTCICKKNISAGLNVAGNAANSCFHQSGLDSFDNTMKDLQRDLSSITKMKPQHNSYSQSERVAAEVQIDDGSMKWCRAVVTKSNQISNDSKPLATTYGLTLVDFGQKVTCSEINMAPLPSIYANIPPYAYKCSLYGIFPVCDVWCSKSVSHFKTMVDQKLVLVEVKRTVFPTQPGPTGVGVFNERPYEVGLRVKTGDDPRKWKSVEFELVRTFRAMAFNPLAVAFNRNRQLAVQKQYK